MTLFDRLQAAVTRDSAPSSDYDLNAESVRPEGNLRDAAVLVAVMDGVEPQLILTKRASHLKHHPGQIAFPGGKVEATDEDVIAAARREAEEEIALRDVAIVGTLAPHETVTGFQVTPVLGIVSPDSSFQPDASEVAEVFKVPLSHVLERKNYLIESRLWRGQPRYFFTVPWGPYYIWGATARMLRALADRMADEDD